MEYHGHDETTNNEHETVSGGKYDGQWLRAHFAQTRTKSTQKSFEYGSARKPQV